MKGETNCREFLISSKILFRKESKKSNISLGFHFTHRDKSKRCWIHTVSNTVVELRSIGKSVTEVSSGTTTRNRDSRVTKGGIARLYDAIFSNGSCKSRPSRPTIVLIERWEQGGSINDIYIYSNFMIVPIRILKRFLCRIILCDKIWNKWKIFDGCLFDTTRKWRSKDYRGRHNRDEGK